MLVTGVGLWAEDACARPEWVTGTWSVTDGRVRRVGDDQRERAQHVGFIVPGMADAHCHIGYSDDGSVSPEEMVSQAGATLASGVTLVRDCGVPVDNSGVRDLVGPRLIRCGRHVARPKRYMRGLPLDVEDQRELPGVLVDMARGSDGWVKIVGDWIDRSGGADSDLMPLWEPAVLRDAVAAVHEAGARIAVHAFSHRVIDSLIEAGVDDIEHGSGIDADQASEIAARGIAVTPTLRQVELFRDFAAQAGTKYPVYAATMQAMYDNRREHFQMLLDADVLLLQGTDSGGYQEHGSIAGELDLWARWGASARTIIDASTWVTQLYLGRPGLVEAGPADLLILDEDPRTDPLAMARPRAVYVGGTLAWERAKPAAPGRD
jgi:hypothetical protein